MVDTHAGPQMGPCTEELVAGATTWALARWATRREAQSVEPKQPDPVTPGQDWSLVPRHSQAQIFRGVDVVVPVCHCTEKTPQHSHVFGLVFSPNVQTDF